MNTSNYYNQLYRERGAEEAFRIAVDDVIKLRLELQRTLTGESLWICETCSAVVREQELGGRNRDNGVGHIVGDEDVSYCGPCKRLDVRDLAEELRAAQEDVRRMDFAEKEEADIEWQADDSGAICGVAILNLSPLSLEDSVFPTLREAIDAARGESRGDSEALRVGGGHSTDAEGMVPVAQGRDK